MFNIKNSQFLRCFIKAAKINVTIGREDIKRSGWKTITRSRNLSLNIFVTPELEFFYPCYILLTNFCIQIRLQKTLNIRNKYVCTS